MIHTFFIKHLFPLALIMLSLTTSALAEQSRINKSTGWGTHGMAVFGGHDGLYASHLPMFHAPHDSQVIIRFHLRDKSVENQLRTQLAQKPELWTLEPEEFDLLRLAPGHAQPLQQFNARFVQGHFERGGVERYLDQHVVIDEVLIFRRLTAKATGTDAEIPSAGKYHLIGRGREYFATKEIDRRPDFDIIVAMKPLAKTPTTLLGKRATMGPKAGTPQRHFILKTSNLQSPSSEELHVALQKQGEAKLRFGSILYFETGDLK